MICQNLRNNLQHPNEFIRGCTLRFLCRIPEVEILEPLLPSILANLEHRHSYVRRNAVLCVDAITKLEDGEDLLPDAPEMIERLLDTEQDTSARRNALQMLTRCAPARAVAFLMSQLDSLTTWGDILQNSVLELIRKACRVMPDRKGKFIKLLLALLGSTHPSVVYECASSLVALSNAPTAVKAAANAYCGLLVAQSDNNVKLIVLERLTALKGAHAEIMQDMAMDILRALSSPSADIRRKTLDIALDLLTPKNIEEVVHNLKKEIVKTQHKDGEKGEYRQMLVQAIHQCAIKYPEVAGSVVHVLMDFLTDANTASALDVVFFVREILETNGALQQGVYEQLLDTFGQIRSSRVCACALWIVGEYCSGKADVEAAVGALESSLGALPLFTEAEGEERGEEDQEQQGGAAKVAPPPAATTRPVVLADGTYATQTSVLETPDLNGLQATVAPNLRALLLGGDFFLGAVIGSTLTKLVLKFKRFGAGEEERNKAAAGAMLTIVGILRLGKSPAVPHPMDDDSTDRLSFCLQVLTNLGDNLLEDILLTECRASFSKLIAEKQSQVAAEAAAEAAVAVAQPDDLIDFSHLKSKQGLSQLEIEDAVASDLQRAMGVGGAEKDGDGLAKLDRIMQLTGFSDPVYAEAYVTVHQYDIVLDITVINRTEDTLQNLCLELATMGDLKLVERPQNYTIGPYDQASIRANIKVSSTETGVIFGNIVYETASNDRNVVILNDIHIDIMDYISPASCPDVAFRNMWAEFEWENKVAINTSLSDVNQFLDHIVESTNMQCLTPPIALEGDAGFLAANLYAKSVFGEDALVNLSVEKLGDGKLGGYIRIRSKTQGIALSLGDKITLKQKGVAV